MKIINQREILSVSEVNGLAKEILERISFWVEGEVYDFKSANSRYYYIYFQLKDDSGMILPAIMLPNVFSGLGFEFTNGQKVLAHGKLTLFTKTGKYQFQADTLELAGEGQLAKELEMLKAKLQAEGLLSQERKRSLPQLPERIGVITSETSDAWADFQRHSVDKFPLIQLVLADVFVQGPRAVQSILKAISAMQLRSDIEVLVLTRGGGSLEDLAAFNDERVVRAIAESRIPTLVAVGHEKDISIADLVADVRASTPTNAGQILTFGYEQALATLHHSQHRLTQWSQTTLDKVGQDLDQSIRHLAYIKQRYQSLPYQLAKLSTSLQHNYQLLVGDRQQRLDRFYQQFHLSGRQLSTKQQDKLSSTHKQLQAVSPLAILERGYSMVEVDGRIVRSSRSVKQGDTMQIRLHKGAIRGLITRVEDTNES